MKFLLPILLFPIFLSAQTSVSTTPDLNFDPIELREVSGDWEIFVDDENKSYYIDFQDVDHNLDEVVVLNTEEEIVYRMNVADLPTNSIYEISYRDFPSGVYTVELRSLTRVMRREVEVD